MKLLLLLSIVILAFSLSPEPVPTCNVPDVTLKNFPISINQVQSFNVNEIFSGYNLNFTLIGAPDFVLLRDKFKLYKSQNITQQGFKSYHLDHDKNTWGKKLVTVSEVGNSTIVRWGITDSLIAVPTLTEKVTLENDPKTTCYDAIWLRAEGLIMVDCAKSENFALQNYFMYINVTTQQVIQKQVKNDMYVAFTTITRRKVNLLVEDGQMYLIRAYFADSVDWHHAHNTYIQIMLINEPYRPWTIKVMDRSFLHQERLQVMDFEVYLGDMYILDFHTGVISFDLTPSQNIIIKGRYRTDSGYHKMGVYANNLDNQVLLALANHHGIYEIDWTNQLRPAIIAKYSIMEGSQVNDLWVTEEYIAAQIVANVTTSDNKTYEDHSSFIFDRGTRTYTNAYAVIAHSSSRAIIDMNIATNQILSIDEDSMDTYQINQPVIHLFPTDSSIENKEFQFTIKAVSRNQVNGHNLVCSFDMRFWVVPVDSMVIFPSGFEFPENYYANYPGELFIPLNRYIWGANITYGVQQKVMNKTVQLPSYWILQQNDTIIHWNKQPTFATITFLRKQQYEFYGQQYFFIYTQDYANHTHVARCKSVQFSNQIHCDDDSKVQQINYKINNLTATAFQPQFGDPLHLVAVVYEQLPNQVLIYNIDKRTMFSKPIMFNKGWQGKIQSIEFLGHYLVVVLRHMKQLIFFDMKVCHDDQNDQCKPMYKIDSLMMDKLGVKYFSPLDVYTSDFHPFVLFIQNVDSVIIVDITRQGPILLATIDSPATTQPGLWTWKMAITHGHLVLINPPNIIQQFSLQQLYTKKQIHMTKRYPLYNYTILDKFDVDFSDKGDLLYITAIDKNLPKQKDSVILVYRSDQPAVGSFYDVFHIQGKYDQMLIDVTGEFSDYVSVVMGSRLMMFRQYQVPLLVFSNTFDDFEFNVTYTNDPQHKYKYLSHGKVGVANTPQNIIINDSKLNTTDYLTNQIKYQNKYQEFVLDDTNWFKGSVVNYTLQDCKQCGNKFRVVNHIQQKRQFFGQTDMQDYVFTPQGGVIQQFQSIISMNHNGSIDQISTFPSVLDGEHCQHIKHSWIYDYTLSACKHGDQVYLYTTTFTSFKPFVNGPFYSGAKFVTNMQIMQDIVMIVDVDQNAWEMRRQGGVLIYAMNHNPFDPEMFDQIQYLDTQDLQSAINWPGGKVHVGNAQLLFTNDTQLYRLAITQVRNGIFFVDFKWSRGRRQIQITKIQFVDLNKMLINNDLHMPNLAFFEAISIIQQHYNPVFNYMQIQMVITTKNFHIFQFMFHFDKTGTIVDRKLLKIFYKYGFYETSNYVKSFDGYFVLVQKIPIAFADFDWYSRQVMTVYDTRERWIFNSTQKAQVNYYKGTNISASYMLGGVPFPRGRVTFDFNFTFTRNRTDPFREISLLAVHSRYSTIYEYLLNDQISIITQEGISSDQQAKLKANNDWVSVSIPVSIIAGGIGGGAIVAIVIGCILVAVAGGYLVYKRNLKRNASIKKELEESLIDRDTLVTNKNTNQAEQEQDQEDAEDQESQEDEQEQEQDQEQEQEKQQQSSTPVETSTENLTEVQVQPTQEGQAKTQE